MNERNEKVSSRVLVACLSCDETSERLLDIGESVACRCGSHLVLIDGLTPADWNQKHTN